MFNMEHRGSLKLIKVNSGPYYVDLKRHFCSYFLSTSCQKYCVWKCFLSRWPSTFWIKPWLWMKTRSTTSRWRLSPGFLPDIQLLVASTSLLNLNKKWKIKTEVRDEEAWQLETEGSLMRRIRFRLYYGDDTEEMTRHCVCPSLLGRLSAKRVAHLTLLFLGQPEIAGKVSRME